MSARTHSLVKLHRRSSKQADMRQFNPFTKSSARAVVAAPIDAIGDVFEGMPVSRQMRNVLATEEGRALWRKKYVPNSDEEKRLVRKIDLR